MRYLLLLFLIASSVAQYVSPGFNKGAGGGGGTWTKIGTGCKTTGSSGTTMDCTLGTAPSTNDTTILTIGFADDISSLSCTNVGNSDSFTVVGTHASSPTFGVWQWLAYRLQSSASASTTLRCTWTTAASYIDAFGDVFRDTGGTPTLDSSAFSANNATAVSGNVGTPSITPAQSGELMYCAVIPADNITAPTVGSTQGVWTGAQLDGTAGGSEYLLSSGTGATACNFTDSGASGGYASTAIAIKQ